MIAGWLKAALGARTIRDNPEQARPGDIWVHCTCDPVTAIIRDLQTRRHRRVRAAETRYIAAVEQAQQAAHGETVVTLDVQRLAVYTSHVLAELEADLGLEPGSLPSPPEAGWLDPIDIGRSSRRGLEMAALVENIHWDSLSERVRKLASGLGHAPYDLSTANSGAPTADLPKPDAAKDHMQSKVFARPSKTLGKLGGYQIRDYAAFDYEHWGQDLFREGFRGPGPTAQALESGRYIAALGAAQTYGRFVHAPYPTLLAERLGVEVANFATGGAGPGFYLRSPKILEIASGAKLCLVQIMSGRSADNSRLHDPQKLGRLRWRDTDKRVAPDDAFRHLIETETLDTLKQIVAETRANYIDEMTQLLNAIKAPKILVWFSNRKPEYEMNYNTVRGIFAGFPQMIDADTVATLRKALGPQDRFVSLSSRRGLPSRVMNRFTGETMTIPMHNSSGDKQAYYPSQEMHLDLTKLIVEGQAKS
ncbi:MAG: DUF6473 family protein [Roseovarius sp.]